MIRLTGSVPDSAVLVVGVRPAASLADGVGTGSDAEPSASAPSVPAAQLAAGARADIERFAGVPARTVTSTITAVLARHVAKGEPGELFAVPFGDRLVVLSGVGDAGPTAARRAGAALARWAARGSADLDALAVTFARRFGAAQLGALAEGLMLGGYSFRVGARKGPAKPRRVAVVSAATGGRARELREALARGVTIGSAGRLARDLATTPSSIKTPDWLARQATAVAKRSGLRVRVRGERQLAAEGFGGVLAVGRGSVSPPRLIELEYDPGEAIGHVVLVGKGITFDTGGLSLKRGEGMVPMKTDMAGGGAVIAAMGALADLGVRLRVTGLVPAAENMPSGSAQRPSDVITHFGGTTVEVLNTDAEGRLVLADALAYAATTLAPDAVVDLATLTGAATLGLGKRHAALYATDEPLAAALLVAADRSGERAWRMPLVDDYRDGLDSDIADLANIDRLGYRGGSIIAALFLREFTGGLPWAHLDIAGPARADDDEHEVTKGASGYGARLLLHWLSSAGPLGRRATRPA